MKNARTRRPAHAAEKNAKINRRSFVKLLPAAGAAGAAITNLDATAGAAIANAQQAQQQPAQRVTKETLRAAEQLIGIELTDAQEAMALPGVNRNLASYEALRKIDVPLDTEPAIAFHPAPPGKKFNAAKTKIKASKVEPPNFKSFEELAFSTVTQLAELVRTKQVSPVELTKMYLARLKKYGPALLCVVTLTEELALKQAEEAEREIRRGKYRGPLHGIPCGVKDLFATKGIKTTWGAEPYLDQMIDYDSTVVERLRGAGAVLLAKLSMGALAQGGRWFAGMTRNPWQPEETNTGSSGSSAGSASATAAGLVGFSIGTETLGSIVSPSSRCGVTGLRPTYGRVSRYGAMGLSWTMDKVGPICRGVEDCALVLNAIHGPDGHDRTVASDPLHWEPRKPLGGLRIGVLQKAFESFKDEEKKIYERALADLKEAGVSMTPVDLSDEDGQRLRFLLSAEAAAAFDDITRDGRVRDLKGQAPGDWPNTFRASRLIPAVEYIRAQRGRTLLVAKFEKFMADWDVLVMPPNSLLTTTNLTGNPQVVMKCGVTEGAKADGTKVQVPRSISFLGQIYDEGSPLRVALAYESVTGWHKKNPT